ncbi:MAG TPA: HD domain-containing protein, partial [Clostridia bacterium]|nr:HD domain-containing protein [Clostridia bacterium]
IIYIADLIEPGRSFKGIDELRSLVWTDLDMGILRALENSIVSLMAKGKLIHPNTLDARNYITKLKKEETYC